MYVCDTLLSLVQLMARRQAITWTNVDLLLNGSSGTTISEIKIKTHKYSFKKWHLKSLLQNVDHDVFISIATCILATLRLLFNSWWNIRMACKRIAKDTYTWKINNMLFIMLSFSRRIWYHHLCHKEPTAWNLTRWIHNLQQATMS